MKEVYVAFGEDPKDLIGILFEKIPWLKSFFKPNDEILLKPNVLMPRESESGATTDPLLVEQLIVELRKRGIEKITIAEGAWVGADTSEAFERCGYKKLADDYRLDLVDLKRDRFLKVPVGIKNSTLKHIKIAKTILDSSKIINLPVLKAHCQAKLTCGMKNFMGAISDGEKRRFHRLDLDRCVFELATLIKPALNICDAVIGDLTFEEGGTPVKFGRVYVSDDLLSLDSYSANTLGYDVDDIGYLKHYKDHFGLDSGYHLANLNEPTEIKDFKAIDYSERFPFQIHPRNACCSCLASIFLALEKKPEVSRDTAFHVGMNVEKEEIDPEKTNVFVGNCNKKYKDLGHYVEGCPPLARDVLDALFEQCNDHQQKN